MIALDLQDLTPGMILERDILNERFAIDLAKNTVLTYHHIQRLRNRKINIIYVRENIETRKKDFMRKYEKQLRIVAYIFETISSTGDVPGTIIKDLVTSQLEPIIHKSDILELLYQSQITKTSYEYQHSMRVGILAGRLAQWMHYDKKTIHEAIIAGLLHDIGKTKIPSTLLSRNLNSLSNEEKRTYLQHVELGYEKLRYNTKLSNNIKQAILQHHEHTDSTGYPNQLSDKEINPLAKVVSIINKYDNVTSTRPGSPQRTPFDAINEITKKMFTSLDCSLCITFIRHIREALIGSEVLLSNQKKGTVAYYAQDDYWAMPLIYLNDSEKVIDLNKSSSNLYIHSFLPM